MLFTRNLLLLLLTTGLLSACATVRLKNPPRQRTVICETSNALFYVDADVVIAFKQKELPYLRSAQDSAETQALIARIQALAPHDSLRIAEHTPGDIDFFNRTVLPEKLKHGQISMYDRQSQTWVKGVRISHRKSWNCHKGTVYNRENGNELWYYFYDCHGHF